jgi:hypothetical protein
MHVRLKRPASGLKPGHAAIPDAPPQGSVTTEYEWTMNSEAATGDAACDCFFPTAFDETGQTWIAFLYPRVKKVASLKIVLTKN